MMYFMFDYEWNKNFDIKYKVIIFVKVKYKQKDLYRFIIFLEEKFVNKFGLLYKVMCVDLFFIKKN